MNPPPGTRVLIVEDETIIAMTAEDMVEELGCVVAGVAETFEAAMAAAIAGGFAVAMLDVNLNGVMSLDVAERLRVAGTPFLFTTGYGRAGLDERFADAIVVHKPYNVAVLGDAISRAIGRA